MHHHRGISRFVLLGLAATLPACSGRGSVLESRHNGPKTGEAGSGGSTGAPDAADLMSDGSARQPEIAPLSGSRVAVVGWMEGSTFLRVKGLRDKQRDVTCVLDLAEDGRQRCLPIAEGLVSYRDSACHDPIVMQKPDPFCGLEPLPAYATYRAGPVCPIPRVHVVRPGASADPPEKVYGWDNLGACVEQTLYGGERFFDAVPSPATDWVAFERELTKVTSDIGVETWAGEDGSRVQGDLRLLPQDIACGPNEPGSSESASVEARSRCIPTEQGYEATTSFFEDGTCSSPVTMTPECHPLRVIVKRDDVPGPCPQTAVTYFDVGKQVANSKVQTNILGPCQPAEAILTGSICYSRGAPIDVTQYPLVDTRPRGSGLLQGLFWQSGGQWLIPADIAFARDARSGELCELWPFADGAQRCAFSAGTTSETYFADPGCKQGLYARYVPSDQEIACGVPIALPRWVEKRLSPSGMCLGAAGVLDVRSVLSVHSGPVYSITYGSAGGGACSPLDESKLPTSGNTSMPARMTFYDLSDPVDPSTLFVEVTTAEL